MKKIGRPRVGEEELVLNDHDQTVGSPSKRQLNQGILSASFLSISFLLFTISIVTIAIIYYLYSKKRKGQQKKAKLRRKAMVKLPMLLSKPKKSYKSVSKTDLLSADQSATKQEPNLDSFNFSEDVQSINETEQEDYIGKITACLQYDNDKNMVVVTIQKFLDLTFVTERHTFEEKRNVSIKMSMFPDNEHSDTTNCVDTTTDTAEFQQQIIFNNIHFQRFEISSIQCKIYVDNQMFGAATQEISKIDKNTNFSEPFEIELNVFPAQEQEESHSSGELLMSLCHQPAARRLSVVILKARNVPKMDISGFSDPYVKIYLHHNNTRSSKKKTHIKKRSLNPVFNESFIFDLPSKDGNLHDIQLEVIMCDWDRITKNEVIGRLILGSRDSEGSCLTHWEEIQKCPRRPIAQWHKLSSP